MQFLCCPDCFGTNFTEDLECLDCRTALLTGRKITDEQKKRNLVLSGQVISTSAPKFVGKTFKQKFLPVAICLAVLICLLGFAYQQSYFIKTKSLETIASQFTAQNELNKFAVETNDKKNLTAITLTQESVKISADDQSAFNIKLIFDCLIEGNILTHTPDEYHVTIVSESNALKDFDSTQMQFQTENSSLTFEKQTGEQWKSDDNSLDYSSHRISRKDLEKLANSKQINFQTGKYQGQLNFAQQQSLRSFLIATSINSKID